MKGVKSMEKEKLNRRDLLKLMGVGGIALGGASLAVPTQAKAKSDKAPNIAIIGAGLGGISLSARLVDDLPNAKITLFDADPILYYQPGFTLIAGGIYNKKDTEYKKEDLINSKVNWVKENVASVNPDANTLTTTAGTTHNYDYLVIGTGTFNMFEKYKGLSEEFINDPATNVTSIYTADGAVKAQEMFKKIAKDGGKVIFAEPNTPIKCGGANKKINFLLDDLTTTKGTRQKVDMALFTGGAGMLSSLVHAKMIEQFFIERKMPYSMRHVLVEVDTARNVAIFEKLMPYTENGEQKMAKERVEKPYDYLFVIPPMKTADFITEAGLAITKGHTAGNWVDVDQYTLQHKKFANIFAIGDCAGIPKGKTGASIRKQYPVIAENLIAHLEGKPLEAKFSGYTACPLLTRYGKAVMVEFDYEGTAPSMPCFGATRESWMNWFVKVYLMKPMVMQAMVKAKA